MDYAPLSEPYDLLLMSGKLGPGAGPFIVITGETIQLRLGDRIAVLNEANAMATRVAKEPGR